MKGTVYKYTFSDNKVYIGQTRHAALRHKEHLDKTSGPTNSAFWEAYQRLGEPEYEILFENEFENEFELESALNIIETYYINYYDATNPKCGYNVRKYGTSNKSISILERIIEAISYDELERQGQTCDIVTNKIWRTKEPLTNDEIHFVKEKFRNKNIYQKIIEEFDFNYFQKYSEEELYLIVNDAIPFIKSIILVDAREKAKEYVFNHVTEILNDYYSDKAIIQLDKQGNVIREYYSLNDVCEAMNISRPENIRNVLRGKQNTAYGYYWKYKKDLK